MNDEFNVILKDDFFDKTSPEKYDLSIRFSSDGFSFLFLDVVQQKFVYLLNSDFDNSLNVEKLSKEWDRIFYLYPWLNAQFNTIKIIIENSTATLIPSALYNSGLKKDYLEFNLGHFDDDFLCEAEEFEQMQAYQVFSYNKSYRDLINKYYDNYTLSHFSIPLIEGILYRHKNILKNSKVFLNVRKPFIDIVIIDKKGLTFFNSFKYVTGEDLLYYLLYIYETHKLNPEDISLNVFGLIDRDSEIFNLIQTYIRNVEWYKRNDVFKYSDVFSELLEHQYIYLFDSFLYRKSNH